MTPMQMSRVSTKWYRDLKSHISDLEHEVDDIKVVYFK